jgi:hypothetical protein
MLRISLASLALALISISALAAPKVSEHERALQKASKWSDMTAQLKGRLPSNVVKEFADYAKDIEFPFSRRIKNKLVLTQGDGTKVTIEYKKDGAISLNGKDWKLKPLATVEEEVTRLALFLNGEKKTESSLFGLMPAAQAGGVGALGAAAAAFAGANAWKAESCGEEELQGDLVNDCPLMAVKMRPILVKVRRIEDPELYLPVSLKCPADNRGTLELISKNIEGKADRIRISVNKKLKPVVVTAAVADKGGQFEDYISVDLSSTKDESEIEFGRTVYRRNESLLREVCNGPKRNKERYYASLASNRTDLSQSSHSGGVSEDPTMEAL